MSAHATNNQLLTEEAHYMTLQLKRIQERLQDNHELARLVPFSVQQRGYRDRNKIVKILSYRGPDPETLHILQDYTQRWHEDPSSFGSPPPMLHIHTNDPLLRSEYGNRSIEDIAASLWAQCALNHGLQQLKVDVRSMIDMGSRYRNIDINLGYGASLVLGTALPENMWTKILPKSGALFERAMDHLRATGIPNIAQQFRQMFERVIEYELSALRRLTAAELQLQDQMIDFDAIGEFEDMNAYPLDASLPELGWDYFESSNGVDVASMSDGLVYGGEWVPSNFSCATEQPLYASVGGRAMAIPSRRTETQLQILHEFYEPLVILRILGPWIGPRIQMSSRPNTSVEESHATLRIFLDRLSWICDYEPGGETVSAIALEVDAIGIVAWLATSHKSFQKAETHLRSILRRLHSAHTLSAEHVHRLTQDICSTCIGFAMKRVTRYIKLFQDFFQKCHDALEASDPLLDRDLACLVDLVRTPFELCAAADRFRDSESLKSLSRLVSATTSPSMWSLLRHYIGRLGSWHRASRTLVEYAGMRPELFEGIRVNALPTPRPIRAPLVDDLTNIRSVLSRIYLVEERVTLEQNIQSLQRLRRFDLNLEFKTRYRDKNFRPRVHAEAWLLEYFYSKDLVFMDADKYIGCSKPSCYCCNLYFQNHQGGFVQRPSHGNVWTNWQSPMHQNAEKQTENTSMLRAMTMKFREDLKAQVCRPTVNQTRVLDSTTGITPSNA
ncbi:hypothetical protein FH972_024286 [Carpinus fangiana]|uniref:Uncharacterized protein n=1 Tax=Carpinus fangiana TaxID=176857 RepID=A0A5N6KY25_9ROSI|nr:hypothetical protein FH972_024286 [Carpinus fangiana]